MKTYSDIRRELAGLIIIEKAPLAEYTTFKIGGPADLLIEVKTTAELVKAVRVLRERHVPYQLLGGGSKILASDSGYRGAIIKVSNSQFSLVKRPEAGYLVSAGAGVGLKSLLVRLAKEGVGGLEFLVGIPGTIGGAVVGNAGAWQQAIGDRVVRVEILSPEGRVSWLNHDQCNFAYRQSRFKQSQEVVLQVVFKLDQSTKRKVTQQMKEYWGKRNSQPREPSAGCIFINPPNTSAGQLIDQCGLKGRENGGVKISEKHANFIVNLGQGKAAEVEELIQLMKKTVRQKHGIGLQEEIVKIGFN